MTRFALAQDNDSHWYVVPVDKMTEWDEWLELDPECDEAWEAPEFAQRVGGSPSLVTFENPEIVG